MYSGIQKIEEVIDYIESNLTAEPDYNEMAKKMDIEAEKLEEYVNAFRPGCSLDEKIEAEDTKSATLLEMLADENATATANAEYESLKNSLYNAMTELKEREQKVITLRFGLDGMQKQTLEEIGKIYGVTKECIRQTEARALNKLKNNISLNLLMDYVY